MNEIDFDKFLLNNRAKTNGNDLVWLAENDSILTKISIHYFSRYWFKLTGCHEVDELVKEYLREQNELYIKQLRRVMRLVRW